MKTGFYFTIQNTASMVFSRILTSHTFAFVKNKEKYGATQLSKRTDP